MAGEIIAHDKPVGNYGSYDLTFAERKDYLEAKVAAESPDAEALLKFLTTISEKVRSLMLTKVLIYREVRPNFSMASAYLIADQYSRLFRGIRTAFVNHHPENTDLLKFEVLVARNRGGSCEVFGDRASALEWLLP